MSQSIVMEEQEGGLSSDQGTPHTLRTSARWAGAAVKGKCSHLGDRAPAERKRDVLLELAHEHVRRQTRVAQLLGEEEVHRRGRGPVPARRLERERRDK